jgi:hypothetical protein
MSFDFSKIAELSTARGKLVELKNSAGRVIWAVQSADGGKVILEVEKITSDTYAGETTYTDESFINLMLSVPVGHTATVTYGGVTRTLVSDEADDTYGLGYNTLHAIFGTFNGVDYNAETPSSGTLTIEGDYTSIACSSFNSANKTTAYCNCVKAIVSLGGIELIGSYGFYNCADITNVPFPNTIKSIGINAFSNCTGLDSIEFPNGLEQISSGAFDGCTNLKRITFKNTTGWRYTTDLVASETSVWEDLDVSDPTANATRLVETPSGVYQRVSS